MTSLTQSIGIFLILTANGWASGRGAGNGGDAVVCRDAGGVINRIELLDYYEARARGIAIEVGTPGSSLISRVETVIARLAPYSPETAVEYRKRAASFMSNTNFIHGHDLIDIPDSDGGSVPVGCKLEQIAVQRTGELLPGDKLYTIDGDLWDVLPIEDQAGLILHEIIYGDSIATVGLNDAQPRGVRNLNGILASSVESQNAISVVSAFQAARLAKVRWKTPHYELDLKLLERDWYSRELTILPMVFHSNGALKSAHSATQAQISSLTRNDHNYSFSIFGGTALELDQQGFPLAFPATTIRTSIRGANFSASMRILDTYADLSPKTGASTLHFENSIIRAYAHQFGELHFYPGYRLKEVLCNGSIYDKRNCWSNTSVRVGSEWVGVNYHLRVAESGQYLETCFKQPQATNANGQSFGVSCARVSDSAAIIRARGWGELAFQVQGSKITADLSSGVERTESGALVSACLSKEAIISNASGAKTKYQPGTRLEFESDGRLRGFSNLPCSLSFGDIQ